jgi:hypothetical protein
MKNLVDNSSKHLRILQRRKIAELNAMLAYAEKAEMYESCITIQNLINELNELKL